VTVQKTHSSYRSRILNSRAARAGARLVSLASKESAAERLTCGVSGSAPEPCADRSTDTRSSTAAASKLESTIVESASADWMGAAPTPVPFLPQPNGCDWRTKLRDDRMLDHDHRLVYVFSSHLTGSGAWSDFLVFGCVSGQVNTVYPRQVCLVDYQIPSSASLRRLCDRSWKTTWNVLRSTTYRHRDKRVRGRRLAPRVTSPIRVDEG
jgi:hypothetical protein